MNAPPTNESEPFVVVPLRPRFFQASAYFPMPVVLLATRGAEGAPNLAPYSLCFPHVTGEGHRMVLVMRSSSKTAENILRSGRVSINFIPDQPALLANCKLLAAPVPTADKMAQSIFKLVASDLGPDSEAAPPLVREAVQVFECRLVSSETSDDEQRLVLEVERVRMQPYWAQVLESGRPGPRLPVDYGFRRTSGSWMSRPGVVVSGPRLRPKFVVEVERTPERVIDDFRFALEHPEASVVGKIRGAVLQLTVPSAELTTWSPSLDLMVVETPTGARVHGSIGPQPQVWTTFMFFHMLLAMCGIGGLMWGVAQSLSGGSAWPLWITVAVVFLHAFVAGAAFVGQGLGVEQIHRLRSFVDDVLSHY